MRYLNRTLSFILAVFLGILLFSCNSTGFQDIECSDYTFKEYVSYDGQGNYGVFTSPSDSLVVYMSRSEASKFVEGQRYEICTQGGEVIMPN